VWIVPICNDRLTSTPAVAFARIAVIRRRRGTWVKGPKTVNHPHQVGLGELLSMASTRLRGEVGGPIGLTKPTNKKLLVALLLRPAIML